MVKPVWIAIVIALGGGIALGVIFGRMSNSEVIASASPVDPAPGAAEIREMTPSKAAAEMAPAIAPASLPLASAASIPRYEAAAISPPTAVSDEAAEYTGFSEPIDVGPTLRKLLAKPPAPGESNTLADAHLALERERRDDSWSYPLEAEIQNSLAADEGMGNFTVKHVQCRATACEIRLSGNARQYDAVSEWPGKTPPSWNQQALLAISSTVGDGNQVDRLIILRKPPEPPKRRPAN